MTTDLERALGAVPASRRRRLARALCEVRDDCGAEDPVFADILNAVAISLVDLEADEQRYLRGVEEQLAGRPCAGGRRGG